PVYSGQRSFRQSAEKLGRQAVEKASPGLRIGEGDILFAYVFLDPLKPPKEVMLQWSAGEKSARAYWGENLIDQGKDGTPERFKVGPLPTTGKWVRLEVEAAKLELKPGTVIDGLAFAQHGGTVFWDHAGLETWTPQPGQLFDT